MVSLSIDGDGACAADIDDAKLTALAEILCAEFVAGSKLSGLFYRNGRTGDDTVDMAVYQFDDIWLKQIVNQKFLS